MTTLEKAQRRFERATVEFESAAHILRALSHPVEGRRPVRPAVGAIQAVVCEYYHIDPCQILSSSRREPLATARLVALALCRQLTMARTEELALAFHRDASLVAYAVRVTRDRAQGDARFARELAVIRLAAEKAMAARLCPA